MSYGRLVDKEEWIEAEIAALEAKAHALLADAGATDSAEDQIFGPDGKDVDLPAELDRREKRLTKLQAACTARKRFVYDPWVEEEQREILPSPRVPSRRFTADGLDGTGAAPAGAAPIGTAQEPSDGS